MISIKVKVVLMLEEYTHEDLRHLFCHIKIDLNMISKKEAKDRNHYMIMQYNTNLEINPQETLVISDGDLTVSVHVTSRVNDLWDYSEEYIEFEYLVVGSDILSSGEYLKTVDKLCSIPLPENVKIVAMDRKLNFNPLYYMAIARWISVEMNMKSDKHLERLLNTEFHLIYSPLFKSIRFDSIRKVSKLLGRGYVNSDSNKICEEVVK